MHLIRKGHSRGEVPMQESLHDDPDLEFMVREVGSAGGEGRGGESHQVIYTSFPLCTSYFNVIIFLFF
jgi:hypothetical protein